MPELKDREIFAVGKWNNIEFSEEDLDDIVANFEKLSEVHKVPLKFGHNDEQPITDGQPAIGWVSRVYRNGKKLFADFADVPNMVVDAIKKKLYRTVSIELLFGVDNDNKHFNHVLDAVALLGADQPAVNTLAGLSELLAMRTKFSGGHRVSFETVQGNSQKITYEDVEMDEAQIKKLIASAVEPLEKSLEAKDAEIARLTKENKEAADREEARMKREQQDKVKMARDGINKLLDDAVREKKMTPANREVYAKQIGVDDDVRVLEINTDHVKLFCNAGKSVDSKPGALDVNNNTGGDEADAGEKLLRMTREYQQKHGEKSFKAAFNRVAEANPELHKEYLNSNGVE